MVRKSRTRVLVICAAVIAVAMIGLWTPTPSVLSAGDQPKGKALADDGAKAKIMKFEKLQNVRYAEIFLIMLDPAKKQLYAEVYNTTELNNSSDVKDTCPKALWDKVDPEALKKQYEVMGVFKNGPRFWCYDWIELPVGAERDFNGLKARWMAQVNLQKGFGKEKGATFYKPTTVARKSTQGYAKGQTVFILDDPEGTPWVMQAYCHIVDKNLKWADLKTLGEKLKLPTGWKYRVTVLDKDLTISAVNGLARIVQDDLESTYNACFEDGGKKNYNWKP